MVMQFQVPQPWPSWTNEESFSFPTVHKSIESTQFSDLLSNTPDNLLDSLLCLVEENAVPI